MSHYTPTPFAAIALATLESIVGGTWDQCAMRMGAGAQIGMAAGTAIGGLMAGPLGLLPGMGIGAVVGAGAGAVSYVRSERAKVRGAEQRLDLTR